MKKIGVKLTQDECSVIMKVITDYIEVATKREGKRNRKGKEGIFIDIEDITRYLKYEELQTLFHVITKCGCDSQSEEKILDWYIENRE